MFTIEVLPNANEKQLCFQKVWTMQKKIHLKWTKNNSATSFLRNMFHTCPLPPPRPKTKEDWSSRYIALMKMQLFSIQWKSNHEDIYQWHIDEIINQGAVLRTANTQSGLSPWQPITTPHMVQGNTAHLVLDFRKRKNIFAFSAIQHWYGTCCWKPSPWKTRN